METVGGWTGAVTTANRLPGHCPICLWSQQARTQSSKSSGRREKRRLCGMDGGMDGWVVEVVNGNPLPWGGTDGTAVGDSTSKSIPTPVLSQGATPLAACAPALIGPPVSARALPC